MAHVSDIKLIRTDTTLDLSQKAEKGMSCYCSPPASYIAHLNLSVVLHSRCGTKNREERNWYSTPQTRAGLAWHPLSPLQHSLHQIKQAAAVQRNI